MRITKENTTGLIIDIQERLFPVMWKKEKLLKNTTMLVSGLNELGIPLVATQQYTKGLGETLQEIKTAVPEFEYIEKRDFSCCDEPSVLEKLNLSGTQHVIICGIESHVCVLQTAIDLKEAGMNPVVVMDCVSSRSPESIKLAKERFRFEGIMMTSAESILFELTRSSAAPEFRAISKLVK
ncbi:Nicotinamidase-related amidase [Tangfeifania diversioriginum]|uniref:Nicotinamidase-related amidase n=1 Tax=Tangfeifania diversioriginum TaxID=1168035 RepID=A0A1M6BGG9_9BACT|nr:isochorismatase family protein [Tangfeifania diversioriginum]SHI47834.1 Nicotinamidase-related amidase [Tangfeifania diversioriginum]